LEQDHQTFAPLARNTPRWKRAYKDGGALERVNSRRHQSFGFERHFIRALNKMALWIIPALLTTLAMP
jgi:hypothetical protein